MRQRQQGDRGVAGERGPKGDHGQHGATGATGATGETGSVDRRKLAFVYAGLVLAVALVVTGSQIKGDYEQSKTLRGACESANARNQAQLDFYFSSAQFRRSEGDDRKAAEAEFLAHQIIEGIPADLLLPPDFSAPRLGFPPHRPSATVDCAKRYPYPWPL